MGEAADDILNGDCCESCGEWIGDGHGYPRQCGSCEAPAKVKKQRKPKPKAEDKQLGFL